MAPTWYQPRPRQNASRRRRSQISTRTLPRLVAHSSAAKKAVAASRISFARSDSSHQPSAAGSPPTPRCSPPATAPSPPRLGASTGAVSPPWRCPGFAEIDRIAAYPVAYSPGCSITRRTALPELPQYCFDMKIILPESPLNQAVQALGLHERVNEQSSRGRCPVSWERCSPGYSALTVRSDVGCCAGEIILVVLETPVSSVGRNHCARMKVTGP
jgi:hypothetical protein